MPLPDAKPTPDKANIYDQFSNIQVRDFTRTNLDVVRTPLFLNSDSEDVMRRSLLIGQVTNQISSSGPINKSQIVAVSDASTSAATKVIFFTSGELETWHLNGLHLSLTGQSGTQTYRFGIIDPNSLDDFVYTASAAVGAATLVFDNENATMPHVSNGLALFAEITGTFTNFKAHYSLILVR
tara:strand:+ start:4 stop:549 length:546 start_codon:yes stop_codon:yes gene_type:complete